MDSVPGQILSFSDGDLYEAADAVLSRGARLRFRAGGSSMHPMIQDGDVLVVEPIPSGSIRVGDIVLYRRSVGSDLRVHRIVAVRAGGRYLPRGDAALWCKEDWIDGKQMMGRVVHAEREGRIVPAATSWSRFVGLAYNRLNSRRGQVRAWLASARRRIRGFFFR
jgi:hypothetical protein